MNDANRKLAWLLVVKQLYVVYAFSVLFERSTMVESAVKVEYL